MPNCLLQLLLQLPRMLTRPPLLQLLALSQHTRQSSTIAWLCQMLYLDGVWLQCFLYGLLLLHTCLHEGVFNVVHTTGSGGRNLRFGSQSAGNSSQGQESTRN
jgi:hypothetical protein